MARTRRNPVFGWGLGLAVVGAGAAVGLYALSRVHRRNAVLKAAGLPPGAAIREVSAEELRLINLAIHAEEPEAPTWVGAFVIKRQFAREPSTSVTVDGQRWGLVEEAKLAQMLRPPSPQPATAGVAGFISGI